MAPVITYKDLEGQDITLLTRVLSQASHGQNASSTTQAHVGALITNLPCHLRSRLPCLAPGCPIHKRLNMAPLDELAGEFQFEISDFVQTIWEPLSKSGQFDYDQISMLGALGAVSGLRTDGCSACWLEFVGLHIDGSVALGAFIMGESTQASTKSLSGWSGSKSRFVRGYPDLPRRLQSRGCGRVELGSGGYGRLHWSI